MNEDADQKHSWLPKFNPITFLQQKLIQKNSPTFHNNSSEGQSNFDPYKIMMDRKKQETGEIANNAPIHQWPINDVKKLEDFCKQMNIVGFHSGNLPPLVALHLLKQKLGIIDEFPKSEGYNPNCPYSQQFQNKIILHG